MDFILLDLERTLSNSVPAFWKGNKHGYTYKVEFAGIFPKEIAEQIVNSDRDKTTIAIPLDVVQKIMVKDLKQHEGY